ncbi:MAG: CHAT domain-containing protein [Candidatus Eisenbacteria bacterium]
MAERPPATERFRQTQGTLPDRRQFFPASLATLLIHLWMVASVLVLASCSDRNDPQTLIGAVPSIPLDVVQHLLEDDEPEFETFSRDLGARGLELLEEDLWRASLDATSPRAFALACRSLERVTQSRSRIFGIEGAPEVSVWVRAATPEGRARVARLLAERDTIRFEDASLVEDKARLDDIVAELEAEGLLGEAIRTSLRRLEKGRELPEQAEEISRRALAAARRAGRPDLACDALGRLALRYVSNGPFDSLHVCMGEAIDIARTHRLPVRLGGLTGVYANYFHLVGREGLATELREESVACGREFRGGAEQLDVLEMMVADHSGYGQWELVERDLGRVEEVVRSVPDCMEAPIARRSLESIRFQQASFLMRDGRTAAADSVYRSMDPSPLVTDRWARDLLAAGRPEEALAVLAKTPVPKGKPTWRSGNLLLDAADAYLQLGDLGEVEAVLARLDEQDRTPTNPWLRFERELLEARYEFAKGSWDGVERELAGAEREFEVMTASDPTGAALYLLRTWAARLRQERRRLARPGLEASYLAAFDDVRVAGAVRSWSERTRGVFLLYEEMDDRMLRWTADLDGLVCDTLSISPEELRIRVVEVQSLLGSDPAAVDAPVPARLVAMLTSLRELLLPEGLEGMEAPLLISVTGTLRLLPFEALPIAGTTYTPILMRHEVAYLRLQRDVSYPDYDWRGRPRTRGLAPAPGLIVTQPHLPKEIRRRYGGLVDLVGGDREAQHLRALSSGAQVLEGADASQERLRSCWDGAEFIYFATHVVRDPENPFWTFLPVAAPPRAAPDESRLEVIDILHARLGLTKLVVLSGCASGAPHVAPGNVSPSLADAFLDAGAEKVVQTFWNVHDEESTELMIRFQDAWLRDGLDPVAALARARRERFESGVTHPFYWAAYAVQMTSP